MEHEAANCSVDVQEESIERYAKDWKGMRMSCMSLRMVWLLTVLAGIVLLVLGYCVMIRWIQRRSSWIYPETKVDAVYIVGSSVDAARRVDAALAWGRTCPQRPLAVLVAEDPNGGCCVNHADEPVPVCDWQLDRLRRGGGDFGISTAEGDGPGNRGVWIDVVPGYYYGTDGEMQALAKYLRLHRSLERVAIVTCRSHARRALKRARVHVQKSSAKIVGVIPAAPGRVDHSPRRVLSENLKLLRDCLGLTYAPLLHRR